MLPRAVRTVAKDDSSLGKEGVETTAGLTDTGDSEDGSVVDGGVEMVCDGIWDAGDR